MDLFVNLSSYWQIPIQSNPDYSDKALFHLKFGLCFHLKFGLCLHMLCLHMDPWLCWYTSTWLNDWILDYIFPYQFWVSDLGMICMICICIKYVKKFWSWFSISLFNIIQSISFKMNWSIQQVRDQKLVALWYHAST